MRLNLQLLNRPEVFIANAATKFDQEGRLSDEPTREVIRKLLSALVENAGKAKLDKGE